MQEPAAALGVGKVCQEQQGSQHCPHPSSSRGAARPDSTSCSCPAWPWPGDTAGAQADCQSQLAGGSSAHPCSRHCTQANKRNTGKDNPTFLVRQGTAVQHQSRLLMEIPPRSSVTALQEHSSSHQALSCQQTGAKPLLRPTHRPTPDTGFDSKGNEQIRELLPKPYQK